MHRWVSALFLLCVTGAIAVLVLSRPPAVRPAPSVAPTSGGPVLAVDTAMVVSSAVLALSAPNLESATPFTGELPALPKENVGAGATLLDGSVPPPLSKSAPAQVRFGAILVSYKGAEQAEPQARARDRALELAKSLAQEADFASAGRRGDVFVPDAGVIQPGFMEPAPQHVLFSLGVGEVGGPVDSPRGFYVFKRLE
jgi:parvulin-like peptidyl-prolyl isomerase